MAKTSTFNGVSNYIKATMGEDIIVVAKNLGYSKDNLNILAGNYNAISESCKRNLRSCVNQRDSRTDLEFAQDLVSGWVFEDIIKECLNMSGMSNGFTVSLGGSDSSRKILANRGVTNKSDFIINVGGKKIGLELISNFTNYWKRTNSIDLRCNKFNELKNHNSLVFAISTESNTFTIFDPNDCKATYVETHHSWNKPAYTISTANLPFVDFNSDNVAKYVKKIVKA